MLYLLTELNSKFQSRPALFQQKQILRSNRRKNLQKQNNEDFFIQMLNAWLHFRNNNFPIPTHVEEILDQPHFKTHTTNWTLSIVTHISIPFHPGIFQTNLP